MEESFILTTIRTQVKTDACSTSRVASNDHMVRIASELCNVLLNPLESFALVMETEVRLDISTIIEESVDSNAIVDADDNHIQITGLDESRSVDVGVGISVETTTLDVEAILVFGVTDDAWVTARSDANRLALLLMSADIFQFHLSEKLYLGSILYCPYATRILRQCPSQIFDWRSTVSYTEPFRDTIPKIFALVFTVTEIDSGVHSDRRQGKRCKQ
ncbi:hypothetical protein HG531_001225 [Fusarium graminearum]|nr:hypothetical protein HG531_001225 [Fusarium graminearum]